MKQGSRIYVAGHRGLVGSALMRALEHAGYKHLITREFAELDLRDAFAVDRFFQQEKPEYVFLAAAKVGGILANSTYPVDFLYDNTLIAMHTIHAAYTHNVKKLLFLGSSCIYPREAQNPITEDALLTGPLEKTNEPYALAKIVGLKLCEAYQKQYGACFISCMPTNLYGPGDTFSLQGGHVIPALITRFCDAVQQQAKAVSVGGTGKVRREFLYVDDLAQALIMLMQRYTEPTTINIGTGSDVTIHDLAYLIKEVTGFTGDIVWNSTFPEGTPVKRLSVERIEKLGWHAQVGLVEGLQRTVTWYRTEYGKDI